MILARLLSTTLFIALLNPLYAQKSAGQKLESNAEIVNTVGLTFSPEQVEAIRQIETEFREREKSGKEKNRKFQQSGAAREVEREEKLRQIFSPKQWQEYQKYKNAMLAGEQKMKSRKKGKAINGNKPIRID